MIELRKCECDARAEIEFDLGDIVLRCPACGRVWRYRDLGKELLAVFEDESADTGKLEAVLGVLTATSTDNTGTKEGKNG